MRSQPGPCLAPGNSPAARRYVRRRKPPPIILWSIGIITCLLFIGAAAMLTVGYLNPFGTVGLAILGVGAVVHFGAILFLVLSCLWVERKYPGMPPLSFKILSRKPNRMPPQTFTNPNISGQMPADTTPSYRMHNEISTQIPGFSDVGEKTDKIPSTPMDNSQDTNDKNPPIQGSSQGQDKNSKIQFTAPDVLQEGDHNGGVREDDSPDIRFQALTNKDNTSTDENTRGDSSTAGIEEKSNPQSNQNEDNKTAETHGVNQNTTVQHKQSENNNNGSDSPKRERKVKLKTHHIEVPFEDYPSSDSSTSLSNKKDKSQDIQKPNPKDNSQHVNSTTKTDNASKSTSATKTSGMDNQKVVPSSVNNLSHTIDAHQKAKAATHSTDKDIKQESSNFSNTEPTVNERKPIPQKHQHSQDSSQMGRNLTSTNSASPGAVSKAREHETIASKLANSVQKDSSPKASPVRDRKLLDVHKNNATNPSHPESVHEKQHASSFLNFGKNMLPSNNNLRNKQQNMTTSPKNPIQNPGSPGGSQTRAQKMQSPERVKKIREDNAVRNSPPRIRKADSSPSPPRHHQKRPDNVPKAQRTQVQSITIQTVSSSGGKEEMQKKKIIHSSPSSQSSDLQSSSSSSPPRQRQRSPNKSPRLPRNGDHTSRKTAFHSSARKEEFSNRQNRHPSPSSQSSDVPSSPSSSPQRTRQKSPDLSTKMQKHKHIPETSGVLSSSNNKDEQRKRSQPSSQPSDMVSSTTSSPLSAKKLLQNKK